MEEGRKGQLSDQPVVVDDGDRMDAVHRRDAGVQVGRLENDGVVDVHQNQHGLGADKLAGGGGVHEYMPVQSQRREVPGADAEGVAGLVGHDVDGHVRAPLRVQDAAAEAACADRRPDGVKVRVAVSHDQHVPASGKPPLQQVDGHAGGDGGIALQRLVRAAVVGQPGDAPALERDLVAAALERHVQGGVGCAVALLHAAVDVGDSHGYRQREGVVPHADIHNFSENREIVLHAPVQHLLREQGEILVPVVFPDHAVH